MKEVVLRKAWEQKVEMEGKHLYSILTTIMLLMTEKRKAYSPLKTALKQKGVRFHIPYTNTRIFWVSFVTVNL